MKVREMRSTDLQVSDICLGTSALGSFPEQYGYTIDFDTAVATVTRCFKSPINFLDTSNEYGGGESERRVGRAIELNGGLPEGFVVATKVDPLPGSSDFSGERVRRSVEESLSRLGLDHLSILYFHDPERITFDSAMSEGGAVDALNELKQAGVVDHLGVAGGDVSLLRRYLRANVFDLVICHNRYTLVDQSAEPLIKEAAALKVDFINAAPYGGGMLVLGADAHSNYAYKPSTEAVRERVHRLERLAGKFGVPLAALALQFSVRNPDICSTIVGLSRAERIDQTLALYKTEVPEDLWHEVGIVVGGR